MIIEAIISENKRTGVSRHALAQYITLNYAVEEAQLKTQLRLALRRLVVDKPDNPAPLVMYRASFKLNPKLRDEIRRNQRQLIKKKEDEIKEKERREKEQLKKEKEKELEKEKEKKKKEKEKKQKEKEKKQKENEEKKSVISAI